MAPALCIPSMSFTGSPIIPRPRVVPESTPEWQPPTISASSGPPGPAWASRGQENPGAYVPSPGTL